MIIYKKETVEHDVLDVFQCDKCEKVVEGDMELQETHSIRFTGGYSSMFGDMNNISCDLCQSCLYDLIGSFCSYNNGE